MLTIEELFKEIEKHKGDDNFDSWRIEIWNKKGTVGRKMQSLAADDKLFNSYDAIMKKLKEEYADLCLIEQAIDYLGYQRVFPVAYDTRMIVLTKEELEKLKCATDISRWAFEKEQLEQARKETAKQSCDDLIKIIKNNTDLNASVFGWTTDFILNMIKAYFKEKFGVEGAEAE